WNAVGIGRQRLLAVGLDALRLVQLLQAVKRELRYWLLKLGLGKRRRELLDVTHAFAGILLSGDRIIGSGLDKFVSRTGCILLVAYPAGPFRIGDSSRF